MAAFNCGTDAEMLGNLIIFASSCLTKTANSPKASFTCCSLGKYSEKIAKILADKEMSLVSNSIPDVAVKA